MQIWKENLMKTFPVMILISCPKYRLKLLSILSLENNHFFPDILKQELLFRAPLIRLCNVVGLYITQTLSTLLSDTIWIKDKLSDVYVTTRKYN